ncbi:cysteine desulfurase family protein [Litoreibacter roseus]|uniref:Cysteine desulfurase n=1 Tax=Litoreibacter roseus TaxID=2601869 RepID=A0A6N6JKE3_9RHOB|nr:cysteine desulfurase family protein [Litoreibacter roseus]GFE66614.1 aminotransferase [Litoreibacter roseus]
MTGRVYLDYNATAPLRPEAREAMIAAMDVLGNPSSVHSEGRAAKAVVDKARGQVARLMGCYPDDLVFTGSATEAAALAIPEFATVSGSEVEHDAVAAWINHPDWDVDKNGKLTGTFRGQPLTESIWDDLVAVQAANSETGVLQNTMPIAQSLWALKRDVKILVDGVQAIGKIPFSTDRSGADYLMASAHKIGGPKGIGALYVKRGLSTAPRIPGGGQEMGRRSGTENIVGIAGFGAAAEAAARDLKDGVWDRVAKLRNILEKAIEAASKHTILVGKGADRLPNTTCFITPGWKGETQVMVMDLAGFAISAGSACSSGKVKSSRVLKAMGYDDTEAASAIRVSLGPQTTEDDVLRFAETWLKAEQKFHAKAA